MSRKPIADIAAGRLSDERLAQNFDDVAPPLDRQAALLESQRCYFCYDAPCITACPTGIDVPGFIRGISTDNLRGAADEILGANIFGGMCARVCPTEILCEGSCVRNTAESKPVNISALQRYATDWVFRDNAQLFERAAETGRHIAVVGAGPAGLACAHALALRGHRATVYERNAKPGGLNEYGIATYKVSGVDQHDFVRREIDWLLSIGGIEVRYEQSLGAELSLAQLRAGHDAVFLAIGLGGVNDLAIEGEQLDGVRNAIDFIGELRQRENLMTQPIGRRVVVIGGGNTAIDAAVQSRKLGAETVTLVYRRGADAMSATEHEQDFAKTEGVHVIHWAQPKRFVAEAGALAGVEFEYTMLDENGRLVGSGDHFIVPADMALKAIGQVLVPAALADTTSPPLSISNGRIDVNDEQATSLAGVWAGGDCAGGSVDLTVQAVEDAKRAAASIDRALQRKE